MKPMPRQHHSRPSPTRHSAEPDASGARRPCVMPSSKACPGHCQSKPISPAFPALTSLGSGAAIQRCNRLLKPPPGPPTTVPAPSYVQAPAFQPRPMADGGVFGRPRPCGLRGLIGIGQEGSVVRRSRIQQPLRVLGCVFGLSTVHVARLTRAHHALLKRPGAQGSGDWIYAFGLFLFHSAPMFS